MPINLPYWHYASQWPMDGALQSPAEITELGIHYLTSPEGLEKEALALDVLRAFHNYLSKYVDMIVRGHLPRYLGHVNEDTRLLLMYLMPKGEGGTTCRG
jgi:hypothetical protein